MRSLRCVTGTLLAVVLAAPLAAQQPTGTVTGQVTDALSHLPLAGVAVTIGFRGAVTGDNGRYTITGVPAGSDSVRTRLIGYGPMSQAVSVTAGQTATVDFSLQPQAVSLASVVVIGYGAQRAGDVTTSVTQVAAKDFNPGPVVTPQSLIENKVAGVEVVDNNAPGGGVSIRVRGQASYTAGSEPLYVVDGVPLGAGSGGGLFVTGNDPLNYLNPNDIASITVLKDAASASIYGTNASNGVVLITTKSGAGKSHVEYGGSFSSSSVEKLPSMLTAAQFRTAVQTYAPADTTQLGNTNTDWFNLIDRTGMGQAHNFSVTGAGPTNDYRFSIGYNDQDGILKGSNTQQVQLRLNYGQRFYDDKLSVRANISGSRSYDTFTPGGVLSNAAQMGPTQPVFNPNDTGLTAPWGAHVSATGYYNWPGNSLTSADNPVEILNSAIDHATTYRSVGSLTAKYDFSQLTGLAGLTGTVDLGYDVTTGDHVTFYPNNIHIQTKNPGWGSFSEFQPQQANTVLNMYANYQPPQKLGAGTVDFTGGYSYSQSHGRFPGVSETQLESNLLTDAGMPQTALQPIPSLDIEDAKLISFFGRAGYNIDEKYLFSASLRRDGSSRFSASNRWANFPAFSAGWRISQEPFFNVGAINDLKLRASWGKTGNQAFANYQYLPTFQPCTSTAEYDFGGNFVCPFRPNAYNGALKWESTGAWDVGADYSILNQRFSGAIDWYRKTTDDLLFDVPVDPASNLSNHVVKNIGSIRNTGFELELQARLKEAVEPGALSWTANFNASHNTNTVVTINPNATGTGTQVLTGGISGGVGSTVEVLEPGQPIFSYLVCRQYYSGGKPVQGVYYNAAGTDTMTGCARGTNAIAEHDPTPHWIFGMTSNMTWRRFDLSFTLRSWLGNYVYNNVASNLGDYRELYAGTSPYNLNSSVLKTGFTQQQLLSDVYVENGSFLRMDNISVGYTFPWGAQQVRLYALMQNAFTITGYSGVDPTAGVQGIDNNIYPRARTFTGGLTVQF